MTAPAAPPEHVVLLDDPVEVGIARGRPALLTLKGKNTERIVFFSDAVFAISITLLVLELRVPEGNVDIVEALRAMLPKLLAYTVSFVVIASVWLSHFRRFRLLVGYDRTLVLLNTLLLFVIVLIPFPTSLFSTHEANQWTMGLYYGVIALAGIIQWVNWVYAGAAGLLHPVVTPQFRREISVGLMVFPVLMIGALVVTVVSFDVTPYYWLVAGPLMFLRRVIIRLASRRHPVAVGAVAGGTTTAGADSPSGNPSTSAGAPEAGGTASGTGPDGAAPNP